MKYLNVIFCIFIMASCVPSQNSFAPNQSTEETIHSLEIDGSAKHSLSFIDISIFSVLSLSLLGFGGQRAYKEFALIREADSLLQQLEHYVAQVPSERVAAEKERLLQHKKELSKRLEDLGFSPLARYKLALLDQHHQLPNGLDAKHAHFAHMRYKIARHFLEEQQQVRILRWKKQNLVNQPELDAVQQEITPLDNAIEADKDKYDNIAETEVATHSFGLKNSVSAQVALDTLETWLRDQANQQIVRRLGLRKPDNTGHAILIATDPIHNQYRLFDPNSGIYRWQSKEQFVKDAYTYLVRIGLKLPNGNDALLNRDLDLRPYLEVSFSQSNVQGDVEEHSRTGGGICHALSLQVAQYLLQHPSTETLTLDKLHLEGIYAPAYFKKQIDYYKSMGMPEKELAMINYWFESQSTIPFKTDRGARKMYKNVVISYKLFLSKREQWKAGKITEEEFLKIDPPEAIYTNVKSNIHSYATKGHSHYIRLARMLELTVVVFDKYKKPDGSWKETELTQIFSWLYARAHKHVYPKPRDGKEKETYNTLKAAQWTLD